MESATLISRLSLLSPNHASSDTLLSELEKLLALPPPERSSNRLHPAFISYSYDIRTPLRTVRLGLGDGLGVKSTDYSCRGQGLVSGTHPINLSFETCFRPHGMWRLMNAPHLEEKVVSAAVLSLVGSIWFFSILLELYRFCLPNCREVC